MNLPKSRGGWTQKCGISEDKKVEGVLLGKETRESGPRAKAR